MSKNISVFRFFLAFIVSFLSIQVSFAAGGWDITVTNNPHTPSEATLVRHAQDLSLTLYVGSSTGSSKERLQNSLDEATLGMSDTGDIDSQHRVTYSGTVSKKTIGMKKYDPKNGPLFDIKSTPIVEYKKAQLHDAGVRFVNPVYSVRMRDRATKQSETAAYLIKNDEVRITSDVSGWTPVVRDVSGIDAIGRVSSVIDPSDKRGGYIAGRYLRTINNQDLVRKNEADPLYWTDIGVVSIVGRVNVRVAPYYGSRIVSVFSGQTDIYILDNVNGWSEIRTEDGTRGYIRDRYTRVMHSQGSLLP